LDLDLEAFVVVLVEGVGEGPMDLLEDEVSDKEAVREPTPSA
jgi:hypothetical protein